MNIEERALVKEAIDHIQNGEARNHMSGQQAVASLKAALEVRKQYTVCEKCLKIGSCDCNVPSRKA